MLLQATGTATSRLMLAVQAQCVHHDTAGDFRLSKHKTTAAALTIHCYASMQALTECSETVCD
jgi:hypothetical protein